MLLKNLIISVNACPLLPYIDEFVPQGLKSQISIMLFLKNTSIKAYLYMSENVTFVSLCVVL